MKLWATVFEHEYVHTVELSETLEQADQRVDMWVKKFWREVDSSEYPHENPEWAREEYFRLSDEGASIVETQLPFPVVLVMHDHAAYMELTEVLGVEPFPYYNAQGGPHWAVFTEVDYRMESIIDVDVPALRKLLTALFERRVFGVIVVGNAEV